MYGSIAGDGVLIDDDAVVIDEEQKECNNPATVGQTVIVESNFATFKGKSRFIIDYDDIVGTPINYLSENIGLVACNNKEKTTKDRYAI